MVRSRCRPAPSQATGAPLRAAAGGPLSVAGPPPAQRRAHVRRRGPGAASAHRVDAERSPATARRSATQSSVARPLPAGNDRAGSARRPRHRRDSARSLLRPRSQAHRQRCLFRRVAFCALLGWLTAGWHTCPACPSILIKIINMEDDQTAPPVRWLTAEEATIQLGVSRPTLYAYVSRNRIGTLVAPDDPRRSLYDAIDVERLAQRKRGGRSRRAVAASTISWGEPILVSAITRIENGRLEYRGRDAVALAEGATLEDVAALLWQVDTLPAPRSRSVWPRAQAAAGAAETCIAAMADLAMAGLWRGRVDSVLPDAMKVLDRMAWSAAGLAGIDVQPSARPIHERLASVWGVGTEAADMIRHALVLTADHELNASTYATRVV